MKYKVGDKILVWRRADKSFIIDNEIHLKKHTDVPISVTILEKIYHIM